MKITDALKKLDNNGVGNIHILLRSDYSGRIENVDGNILWSFRDKKELIEVIREILSEDKELEV